MGHIIIYPQQPSKIEITSPVCVLFVSSSLPTPEWPCNHAKPLAVNAGHRRTLFFLTAALQWLKTHNHLYKDIQIDEECLCQLNENPVLPFSIEHILPSAVNEASTTRHDSTSPPPNDSTAQSNDIPFQDRDFAKGGDYIEIPRDHDTENEFCKDSLLFPMIYPTLFPYGIGGPEDARVVLQLRSKK
ncbi:hypothetical protein DFH08DRAFT_916457 [Mycena albidolilacea]|uniref:DUF6570 domain-containing protein n=1 Tax=Mycena albidolilacea TaxID=1033008 RepID=A0AAD6ZNT8_9AGAR|nr:hypothetical protein DFH08DRAFT_916457 [Mycena albidolilacea]